ncbi:MAG TPA: MarR family transcriptional regulator [Candidatus Binatia bacterium]|nr:MarR family transcriptional regulator [Candidatus Binatia bacterium]
MKSDKRSKRAGEPGSGAVPAGAARRRPLAPELCSHLGFVLAKARQELVERMERVIGHEGLSLRHFGTLLLIAQRGAMRQTELCGAIRLDRTTMMNVVDELEDAGLVRREADPQDRRANAVTVTARGQKWLARVRPRAEREEEEFLAPLSAGERERMRQLLMRLVVAEGER